MLLPGTTLRLSCGMMKRGSDVDRDGDVRTCSTHSPLALTIASLGIFPGEQAVVFLAPVVSSSLLICIDRSISYFKIWGRSHRPIICQDTGPLTVPSRRESLCWLHEASAEKKEGFISSAPSSNSSFVSLSCEESVVIRRCFPWSPSGFPPGRAIPSRLWSSSVQNGQKERQSASSSMRCAPHHVLICFVAHK